MLADNKTAGGRGRLTDVMIDKLQNYYCQAIRNNQDLESMKNAIWAIFYHIIKSDENVTLDEQHKFCPTDSWCTFWTDNNYSEKTRLPNIFQSELKPIFDRLSKDDILSRCLKGLTQNQNEAINGILWSICPKTKFCGCTKVATSVT